MLEAIIIAAALIAGIIVGVRLYRRRSAERLALARHQAERVRVEAQRSVELTHREIEAEAAEEQLRVAREADDERNAVAEQIERLRVRIERGHQRRGAKDEGLVEREGAIDGRFKQLRLQRDASKQVRNEAKDVRRSARGVLEERAGQSADELAAVISERLIEDTRSQCADLLRNLESTGNEGFIRDAKRVMGITMARYTGHCQRDRGVSTVALTASQAEKLSGEHAELVARLADELSINIVVADSGESVRLETGDGVARELCRRALLRFTGEKRVRDPEKLLRSIRADLEREIVDLGKKALSRLGLAPADAEILDLLGRLNWRTSYTQNQYRHAIEAATLSGLIAEELGLDPIIARRSALMHDIGKALTHAVDGSHALNGAEIARRVGEDEVVCNAIGAHHGEEPMNSAYAWLAAATDAMSGGRPGARREIVESYGDRIGDIERIAAGFRGVSSVHAMQAGREVRVLVDERRVRDGQLDELSAEIADKISDELTFPGQIKVTVIREFRSTSVAN